MHSQIRMLWILFYIEIFIPRNTCSLAWTHAGLSEEIISEANAVSLIVLSDWLLLFVLCAFGQRSGVLFQAVFRLPCFFSVHAPAQHRPFFFFRQIRFAALYENLHWQKWQNFCHFCQYIFYFVYCAGLQFRVPVLPDPCLVLKKVDTPQKNCMSVWSVLSVVYLNYFYYLCTRFDI